MTILEFLQSLVQKAQVKAVNFTDNFFKDLFDPIESLEPIIHDDTDFDELLEEEAPAAGAQGGLGHNFTRNDRIVEEVNPPGFEFPGTARDVGEIELGKAQGDEDEEADPFADTIPREEDEDNTSTPAIIPDEPITDDEPPVEPITDDEDDDPDDDDEDDEDDEEDDEDEDDDDENDDDEDEDPDDEDDEEDDEDDDDQDDDDEDEDPDDEDPDDEEDDDEEDRDDDDDPPDDDDELTGQNPGNDKEVGNSPWDGETGASGKEGKGKHQDGIDTDENQPGGKEKGQNLSADDLLDIDENINNGVSDYDIAALEYAMNTNNNTSMESNPVYDT